MKNQTLDIIFNEYWDTSLSMSPSMSTFVGKHDQNDKLEKMTPRAQAKWMAKLKYFQKKLESIPESECDEQQLISRAMLLESIYKSQAFEKWPVDCLAIHQMGGVHLSFLNIARVHPFRNLSDGKDYGKRLKAFSSQLKQVQSYLKKGVESGWVLSRRTVSLVIPQLKALIQIAEQSNFYRPAEKLIDSLQQPFKGRLKRHLADCISAYVNPALEELAEYMEFEYLPHSRQGAGLCYLPQGKKLYQLYLNKNTTLGLSAEEVHDTGLKEVERIHEEMKEIQKEMGISGSLNDFFQYMREAPEHHYSTREEIVEHHKALSSDMEKRLPEYFSTLPKNSYNVEPMPAYQEREAPDAYYMPGNSAGNRPGTYYVNTYEPASRGRFNAEALAFHEAMPGHHFQISIAQELEGLPEFRKRSQETAYVEGWALYTEKLAEEMGFCSTPESRFGRLCFEVWRACRLVVDTGIHAFGWSREKAIDYMCENTALSRENIAVEVDRYMVMPGQAVSYKTGEIFIMQQRKKLMDSLGDKFDLKKFHDAVLKNGAVPLPVLKEQLSRCFEVSL